MRWDSRYHVVDKEVHGQLVPVKVRISQPAHVSRCDAHTKRKGMGRFKWRDLKRLYHRQSHRCYYCLEPLGPPGKLHQAVFHIEHRTPLSRGGSNYPHNVCLACPGCNMQKGTMTADEYLAFRRRKTGAETKCIVRRKREGGIGEEAVIPMQETPSYRVESGRSKERRNSPGTVPTAAMTAGAKGQEPQVGHAEAMSRSVR